MEAFTASCSFLILLIYASLSSPTPTSPSTRLFSFRSSSFFRFSSACVSASPNNYDQFLVRCVAKPNHAVGSQLRNLRRHVVAARHAVLVARDVRADPVVSSPPDAYWLCGVITIRLESVFSSLRYSSATDPDSTSSVFIVRGVDQLSLAVIT